MYNRPPTIGEYLLRKLESYGIEHIFGIPGDYVLRFYKLIEQSSIQHVRYDTREMQQVTQQMPTHAQKVWARSVLPIVSVVCQR